MTEHKREYRRTLGQIREDGLWPYEGGLLGPDPLQSIRHQAIHEVLTTMPDADYKKLKAQSNNFY